MRDHNPPSQETLRRIGSAGVSDAVVDRVVSGTVRQLARQKQSESRLVVAAWGAAAATALGVGFLVVRTWSSAHEEVGAPLAEVTAAASGQELAAGPAPSRAALGRHRVVVEAGGRLRVERIDSQQVEVTVAKGASRFAVEHLTAGERFRVRAGAAEVEVVGTKFEVALAGPCTEVEVTEGRVRVTHEKTATFVSQGERRAFCPNQAGTDESSDAQLVREALVLISNGTQLEHAAQVLADYRSRHPEGEFAQEALFHLSVIRLRQSRLEEARALADEFRRRFPGSQRIQTLRELLERREAEQQMAPGR